MSDESIRGRFVWHELLTTNTGAAAVFYKKVVGWKTAPWPNDAAYTLFTTGDRPVAGLMSLPEDARKMGAPPSWLAYVGTTDVDATARRIAQLGGKLLRPAEDIPSAGRFAIVQDPQGAVFGLYTPAQPAAAGAKPKVGEFSWHELVTDDPSAAWTFYQTLFGWEKTSAMDMGPELGTYQMFGWNDQSVGGILRRQANVPAVHWMPYALVADAKAAARVVTRLGGRIVNGPMEVPGGDWIANGIDMQGAAFSVHSRKPAARKPAASRLRKKAKAAKPARKAGGPARKARPARRARPVRRAGRSRKKR